MTKAKVYGISFDHPEVRTWRDKAAGEWRKAVSLKSDEEQKAWFESTSNALVCTLEDSIGSKIPEGELRTYLNRSAQQQQLARHLIVQNLITP